MVDEYEWAAHNKHEIAKTRFVPGAAGSGMLYDPILLTCTCGEEMEDRMAMGESRMAVDERVKEALQGHRKERRDAEREAKEAAAKSTTSQAEMAKAILNNDLDDVIDPDEMASQPIR